MENSISNEIRSQVLIDALPYIQKYNDKIVVIKYGGAAMVDEQLRREVTGRKRAFWSEVFLREPFLSVRKERVLALS